MDSNKKVLSILSAVFLALVPWMQVSKAVQQNVPITFSSLAACVMGGIAIHTVFLAGNSLLVSLLRLGKGTPEQGMPHASPMVPADPVCMKLRHPLVKRWLIADGGAVAQPWGRAER